MILRGDRQVKQLSTPKGRRSLSYFCTHSRRRSIHLPLSIHSESNSEHSPQIYPDFFSPVSLVFTRIPNTIHLCPCKRNKRPPITPLSTQLQPASPPITTNPAVLLSSSYLPTLHSTSLSLPRRPRLSPSPNVQCPMPNITRPPYSTTQQQLQLNSSDTPYPPPQPSDAALSPFS